MVVEKSEWESKVEMVERAKREEEEDKKWETFMIGRGNIRQMNESVMTKTDTKGPVYTNESDANYTSTDGENINQIMMYRSNTTTEAITITCPTVAVQDDEAHPDLQT